MSEQKDYFIENIVYHCQKAGMTNEELEDKLARIKDPYLRSQVINNYIDSLPVEERQDTLVRLGLAP